MAETLEVRRAKPAKLQKVAPRRAARLGRSECPHSGDAASRELLAAVPAAVYTTDAKGCIPYYNEAAAKLWGRRPELGVSQWCGSWRLYRADGTPLPHDECPMADALKSPHPARDVE